MNNSKTILLTGFAGFIASHLLEALLLNPSNQIIGIDNFNDLYDPQIKIDFVNKYFAKNEVNNLVENIQSPYRHFQNSDNFSIYQPFIQDKIISLQKSNLKIYGLDLCDYKLLRKVFEENKITHIVNLAALAGVRPSVMKPTLYIKNNGESTANLLNLAVEFKISKFIHASSSSVYGARSKHPFAESEDISKPLSPYAASKVADEALLHTFSHLFGIQAIALRFFTVYGPRQRPDLAIHKFTKLIDENKEIEIYGDGSFRRDFTYIDDILDGILKAMDYETKFDIFNLGEAQGTDVNQLVRLIEKSLGKKAKIKYTDAVPGDVPLTFANIDKAKSLLGYNPKTLIDSGIDKFVNWYRASKNNVSV